MRALKRYLEHRPADFKRGCCPYSLGFYFSKYTD